MPFPSSKCPLIIHKALSTLATINDSRRIRWQIVAAVSGDYSRQCGQGLYVVSGWCRRVFQQAYYRNAT